MVFWLTLAGFVSWFLSTLAGGGTPLLLVPVIGLFLGSAAVPPVLTIGMLLGHPQRVILYWRHINWQITAWYLPGAAIGASLGAFLFTQIQLDWLPILLAVFLLISTFGESCTENRPSWVRVWHFLPGGLIHAFLSGLIGGTASLLNPLYLNYGLVKEEMLATKSTHMLIVHSIKMVIYVAFGAFSLSYLGYGLILGLAALPGNWVGQLVLQKLSQQQFRKLAVAFIAFSGIWILGNELFVWFGKSAFASN